MNVRELRELLMKFPDDCKIYEARQGEHRELKTANVFRTRSIFDADEGLQMECQEPIFLVFGAWS